MKTKTNFNLNIDNFDRICDDDNRECHRKHFLLPEHPFRMLMIGGSGSGKTNLLLNMIFKFLVFDKIYLYSKHLHQSKYVKLIDFFEKLQETVSQKVKQNVEILQTGSSIEEIIPVEDIDPTFRNVVIIDDFVTEKDQKSITDLFIRGRHTNTSIIYLSQTYFRTPRDIRLNSSHLVLFDLNNRKEVSLLYDEIGTDLAKDKFFRIYNDATSEPFQFFYVDRSTKFLPLKYRKGLNNLLISN